MTKRNAAKNGTLPRLYIGTTNGTRPGSTCTTTPGATILILLIHTYIKPYIQSRRANIEVPLDDCPTRMGFSGEVLTGLHRANNLPEQKQS